MSGEKDVTVEWGIRHWHGTTTFGSAQEAQQQLPAFIARYEGNFRNTIEPFIVRREVSAWTRLVPPAPDEAAS